MDKEAKIAIFMDKVDNAMRRSGLNTIEVVGVLNIILQDIYRQQFDAAAELIKESAD